MIAIMARCKFFKIVVKGIIFKNADLNPHHDSAHLCVTVALKEFGFLDYLVARGRKEIYPRYHHAPFRIRVHAGTLLRHQVIQMHCFSAFRENTRGRGLIRFCLMTNI